MFNSFDKRYRHFTKRPLVAVLPLFFAGLLVSVHAAFLLLLIPGVILAGRWKLLGAIVFAIGFLRVALSPAVPQPLPNIETDITGTIVSTPNLSTDWQRALLNTGERYLLLYTRPDRDLRAGDVVRFVGTPRTLSGDSAAYWYRRGVRQSVYLYASGEIELVRASSGFKAFGSAWRRNLLSRLRAHLPEDVASVAMGVVAGQQNLVPRWVERDMQRTGTLHLLATSGFNVLLLAGALLFLAAHLPLPRALQIVAAIVVLLVYADAVGGRAPVMRATVMAAVFFSAYFLGRSSDGISAAAFAGMACAVAEPWTVLDAGYQLSFLVVFGLLLFVPGWFRRIRAWTESRPWAVPFRWAALAVGSSLATTLVAMAFASPLLSNRFGSFSIVAPIANLLTTLAVPFVYLGVAIGSIGDLVSSSMARGADTAITGPFSASIIRVNHTLAQWSFSSIEGLFLPAWACVAAYIVLFGLSKHLASDVEEA